LNQLLEEFNESQTRKEPPPVQRVPMQQQQSRIMREDKE
jgi:hypothetical protein